MTPAAVRLISETRNYYDGPAFTGLALVGMGVTVFGVWLARK